MALRDGVLVFEIPGQTLEAYAPLPHAIVDINDPLVRRLFAERGALYRKKRTVIPIKYIHPSTGRVEFYQPSDTMIVRDDPLLLAVHMALFHTLGWSDEEPDQEFYLPFIYHSFLLAFAVDDAMAYTALENKTTTTEIYSVRQRNEKLAHHYLRANYWMCRIRCCDKQADGSWKDCTPKEAYNRTVGAVKRILCERGCLVGEDVTMAVGSAATMHFTRYTPALVVWPDDDSRTLANSVFRATEVEESSHPHCISAAQHRICSVQRANSAARLMLSKPMGASPITVPPAIRNTSPTTQQLMVNAFSIGTVKQAGKSIQVVGDDSGYANEWERIMRDYDEVAAGNERAQIICKEMLVRGYTPITVAEQQQQQQQRENP